MNEKLSAVDFNEVTQYPLFDECDETAVKQLQLQCFKEQMMLRISRAFNDTVYQVDEPVQDTLLIDFKVDEDGFVSIIDIQQNTELEQWLPNFRQEVVTRLNDLTTVVAAHKEGVPVSVRFRLPLIIDTER